MVQPKKIANMKREGVCKPKKNRRVEHGVQRGNSVPTSLKAGGATRRRGEGKKRKKKNKGLPQRKGFLKVGR